MIFTRLRCFAWCPERPFAIRALPFILLPSKLIAAVAVFSFILVSALVGGDVKAPDDDVPTKITIAAVAAKLPVASGVFCKAKR